MRIEYVLSYHIISYGHIGIVAQVGASQNRYPPWFVSALEHKDMILPNVEKQPTRFLPDSLTRRGLVMQVCIPRKSLRPTAYF